MKTTIMNGHNNLQLTGSRRTFFTKTAALFGAGALASKIILAQQTTTTTSTPAASSDIDILNYALSLEHLEAAFYAQGVTRYTSNDFVNGNNNSIFGSKINANVVAYIQTIRDHEIAHVAALRATISRLGGTPVSACSYNFGVNNVNDFLTVAAALENTGVSAYDGAIALISDPDIKQAAATIATVEARHASYLNVLNGQIPFPSAFDTPRSRAETLAIAARHITSCPDAGSGAGNNNNNNAGGPTIRGLSSSVTTLDSDYQFDFSASSASGDGSAVSFQFTQVSGPQASIIAARTSMPRALLQGGKGIYVFEVVIVDGRGGSQRGRTSVTYK